ncbi:DNA/RNA helicase domain-containing protein [Pseudohongiella sp. O18]|uniref:DNA/RNA helicase domain-containing protein n=1 Tax=Pseudohongiella sp. O18 TaxID=2904248 RepID=UPI001F2D69AD|nr:DNA/RNA helicase domain-containing protein [Pseudohongiella sp. O18]
MSGAHDLEIRRFAFQRSSLEQIRANGLTQGHWPLVYVLSNAIKGRAYVGETADTVTRMEAHLKHNEKSRLTIVHLIQSDKFNKSATLDIESNLIKYMAADGKFALLNGNLGLVDHNYYQKEQLYSGMFRHLWDKLRAEGLAQHSIEHLDNSDLFKYSPYKTLSADQRQGLLGIMYALLDDQVKSLIVEGGAGTGKSVLAIFLFKLLQSDLDDFRFSSLSSDEDEFRNLLSQLRDRFGPRPKMALVVPMASFRATVEKAFANVAGLSRKMVISPSQLAEQQYDIVLVDEAHRLRRRQNLGAYYGSFDKTANTLGLDPANCSEVDWVTKQSNKAVFFYDLNQTIKPSDTPTGVFEKLKLSPTTQTQQLVSQFRVRGGNPYVQFINRLLHGRLGNAPPYQSKNYELRLFDSFAEFVNAVRERDDQHGLSRMIAGYAWPWVSNKNSELFDIQIEGVQLRWNSTSKDWINAPNSVNEVGCIHTTQGYDLNIAGVIFGREIGYDKVSNEIIIRPELYFDRNGKQSIKNPEELKIYILNIYQTILLRGIRGTFIYACDPDLRDYLAQHIATESQSFDGTADIVPIPVKPFINAVPVYDLIAAAGDFSEQQRGEHKDWTLVPEGERINESYFACKVQGESMNNIIPNGAMCLFRTDPGGSRNGKIVLVEMLNSIDEESGSHYTIKEYASVKSESDDGWAHEQIMLKPRSSNTGYEPIVLGADEVESYRVVGVFVRLLTD